MSKEASEETGAKGGRRTLVVGGAVLLGLLVGGGAGAFLAGPLLANRVAPAVEGSAASAGEAHGAPAEAAGGHGAEEDAGARPMYVVEGLVLNPARSNGTRFLMATVAFGMRDEAGAAAMQGRELEVRDRVLGVLGAKTVIELSDVALRDSLKLELRDSVGTLLGGGAVRAVYFPQFVIQ